MFSEVVVQLLSEVRGHLSEDPDEGHVQQGVFGETADRGETESYFEDLQHERF